MEAPKGTLTEEEVTTWNNLISCLGILVMGKERLQTNVPTVGKASFKAFSFLDAKVNQPGGVNTWEIRRS